MTIDAITPASPRAWHAAPDTYLHGIHRIYALSIFLALVTKRAAATRVVFLEGPGSVWRKKE